MKKSIVITGGTGFLGEYLTHFFSKKGYHIYIISRSEYPSTDQVTYLKWDGKTLDGWEKSLEGATAVINLAGKSVNCRYTDTNKRIIKESRVLATEAVGKAIQQATHPPKVWLNGGSATYYRYSEDKDMTEATGEAGTGFSVEVCQAWEAAFDKMTTPDTRKIFMKISIVLGKDGGVMPTLKGLIKAGLGGKQGHGRQYVSWLHEEDFARMVEWFIAHDEFDGIVNCVSPRPVKNKDFMAALRKVYTMPFGLGQPRWMLELGAIMLGTETELILKSRKVVPERLTQAGFTFKYPKLDEALQEIVSR